MEKTMTETASPTSVTSPIGTIRVDITRQQQKAFEAVYKSEDRTFQIQIDEPQARGGTNQGPSPLSFFVAGTASCLAMQYVNVLQERPLPLEGLSVVARAHNDREARVFTDMVFHVNLTGPISPGDAEALARAASKRCFAENTLDKAIPLTTEVELNGDPVVTLERRP
jgi:putative redox protein